MSTAQSCANITSSESRKAHAAEVEQIRKGIRVSLGFRQWERHCSNQPLLTVSTDLFGTKAERLNLAKDHWEHGYNLSSFETKLNLFRVQHVNLWMV